MPQRDDFKQSVKNTVAARAGYRCSICQEPTIGPTFVQPEGIMKTGIASHIRAASPKGPRYDSEMTKEERGGLDNAIWLCANHSIIIDRDVVRYTVDVLHKIKREHEDSLYKRMDARKSGAQELHDLIALGPNVIIYGEVVELEETKAKIWIDSYIYGETKNIVKYISEFSRISKDSKYLIDNAFGIGRVLVAPPTLLKEDGHLLLKCRMASNVKRESAHELANTIALDFNETGMRIGLKNGSITSVGGVDLVPQLIAMTLSIGHGELVMSPCYGSRMSELYSMYKDSPWLEHIIKLEILRLSSIPYQSEITGKEFLPLRCVNRVNSLYIVSELPDRNLVQIHLELDLEGYGPYCLDTYVYISI